MVVTLKKIMFNRLFGTDVYLKETVDMLFPVLHLNMSCLSITVLPASGKPYVRIYLLGVREVGVE